MFADSLHLRSLLIYLAVVTGSANASTNLEMIEVEGSKETYTVSPSDIPQGLSFSGEELLTAPGSGGDVLRSIDSLPGIAVNDDGGGGAAIRGSRPENNEFIVDFLPSGYLFHFTGDSVIDGDLVKRFDLYPAGFGAEFQGRTGGVISVDTRAPKDTFSGAADISLINAGLLVEGSPRDDHGALFSTRVSYYDLLLEDVIDDDEEDYKIVQLPKYFDYRGKYHIKLDGERKLQLLFDGAGDDAEFILKNNADEVIQDPVRAGRYAFDRNYHRQGVVYQSAPNGSPLKIGLANRVSGTDIREGNAGTLDITTHTTTLKAEYQPASVKLPVRLGLNLERIHADYDASYRDPGCTEFEADCRLTDAELLQADRDLTVWQLQTFAETSVSLGEKVLLTTGLGLNTEDYLDESHLEPRVRLQYALDNDMILSSSYGRYFEFPDFAQVEKTFGNPELEFFQSDHFVVGAEQHLSKDWFWKIESYYKTFDKLVTGDENLRYRNNGDGQATGLELFVKKAMSDRWSGWLSLSWSEAERRNKATGERFDFEFDQPVIASLVLKRKVNEKISVSTKTRFHSGSPYTPILGGVEDSANPGSFRAVYGELNSERLPNYFRLDLRIDYQSRPGATRFYAELINATNHKNISGYDYNTNFSQREDVEQLPVFIYFGIRKEW